MALLNVNEWTVQQVIEWIEGLDPTICTYGPEFIRKQINGARLLNLMAGDLEQIGVYKVGDQLLLHDAIQALRDEMETDRITLQTLASNLSVRCKTYRSELSDLPRKNKIPTQSLSTGAYLLDASKTLVRWLTRYPFLGVIEYDEITKKLTRHGFELALLSQRDTFADNTSEEVQYLCTKLIELCDYMIHTKDSLAYQPAAIDIINIRKRHEQELGLQFETSYFGLHLVSGVDANSPAQQSGGTQHLERGDEILQVNYQTVVGWVQPNVISLLHENPCEVILTIKRRPRHCSNILGHMYLKPNRVPVRKIVSPVAEEASEKEFGDKETKKILVTGASQVQDLPNMEPTSSASSNAEARFWKLYPTRPRGALRRRATVSGTSPISTRPPVTFIQDDNYAHKRRPPLDKSKSESNKLDVDDQILKLFVGDSNVKGSRVTLPFMENLSLDNNPAQPNSSQVKVNPIASAVASSIVEPSKPSNENPVVKAATASMAPKSGGPIYAGYLHERAHWKFGPRWNRHKAALYPKLLVVGSHSFQISSSEYQVLPAIEVHSRPFAFKLEKAKENQEKSVVYIAAESEREMQIWLKLLCKECGLTYPFESYSHLESVSGGKLYRRSFSLQSTGAPEKPPRRSSLPQKHDLKVAPRYRMPLRTDITKLKSQSTSRLDERRSLSSSTSTPPPYAKSNISSITITSLRRDEGESQFLTGKYHHTQQEEHKSPSRAPAIFNPLQLPNPDLSCSPFEMSLDYKPSQEVGQSSLASNHNQEQRQIPDIVLVKPKRSSSSSSTTTTSPITTKNCDDPRKDMNRNLYCTDFSSNSNNSYCSSCGTRKVTLCDSSCQTDDNLFLLITGNHQSIV